MIDFINIFNNRTEFINLINDQLEMTGISFGKRESKLCDAANMFRKSHRKRTLEKK